MFRSHILVCGGTGCTSAKSMEIIARLEEELKEHGLDQEIAVVKTGCFGLCAMGPIMVVYPEQVFYCMVTPDDVPEIVEEHLVKGRPVQRLIYDETLRTDGETVHLEDTDFYRKQKRIALRNCGVINPENIEEYIAQRRL